MANPKATGMQRVLNATRYSIKGLTATFQNEAAFRQELFLTLVAIPLALWFGENGIEYALLIGSHIIVLIVELLNSAIEAIVDRVGTNHHELSGMAKDAGSAAVFMSLILAALVWVLVLFA